MTVVVVVATVAITAETEIVTVIVLTANSSC